MSDFVIENGVLLRYQGSGGETVIPEGVTAIGEKAFSYCSGLTRVELPGSLVSIGMGAFYGCESLAQIRIPESVTEIGNYAFYFCRSLKEIVLPPSLRELRYRTFAGCSCLSRVVLPEGLAAIGHDAFQDCEKLTHVNLPKTLVSLGTGIFKGCKSLSWPELPEGITAIPDETFLGCACIRQLQLPSGVRELGYRALAKCIGLTEVEIGEGVTAIGEGCFHGCKNLARVVIQGSPELGSGAFDGLRKDGQILAPHLKPEAFDKPTEQTAGCLAYLLQPGLYTDKAVADSWRKKSLSRRKALLKLAFGEDLVQIPAFYGREKKITGQNFEEEYLSGAEQAGAKECVAWLLDWKNRNMPPVSPEAALGKELEKDPFNAADMKKLWTFEPLADGSLMITGYKGEARDVEVPERIGNRPVTRLDTRAFSVLTKADRKRPAKQAAAMAAIESICLPESITAIGRDVFDGCKALQRVIIRGSRVEFNFYAFPLINGKICIHAPAGSTAQTYARTKKIPFREL